MKRLLPFIIIIVLILTALVSVPFLLRPESHRGEITTKLSALLKRPVVIGPLSMTYWPPTLRLAQVAVMDAAGNPVLQIDNVDAVLDLPSLLHLHFSPAAIQLNHPVLTATRRPDGSWDVDGWLSGFPGITGDNAGILHQVSWKAGEVHGMDRFAIAPQELVLSAVDGSWDTKQGTLLTVGTFSGIGAPAHLSLSAKGQFFSTPQWSGDVQLTEGSHSGTVHLEKQPTTFDLKGVAGQWTLTNALAFVKFYGRGAASATAASPSGLLLENWQFHAREESDRLTFEHSAIISGGLSEIKGSVGRQAGTLVADVDVAVKEVPVEALLIAAGETISLSGKVTSITKDFEVTLSTSALSSLKGQGYFELKDGRYKLPDVSLQKLAKAKSMAYLKKKFPDLEQNGIPVSKLSAHWQAKDGKVSVADGFFMSDNLKIGAVGSLDVPHQGVDGYLRLQLHEKDPTLSRLIPAKYHTQPAFGRLQGTWQEWYLRATTASKIPSATQSKLSKAANQK